MYGNSSTQFGTNSNSSLAWMPLYLLSHNFCKAVWEKNCWGGCFEDRKLRRIVSHCSFSTRVADINAICLQISIDGGEEGRICKQTDDQWLVKCLPHLPLDKAVDGRVHCFNSRSHPRPRAGRTLPVQTVPKERGQFLFLRSVLVCFNICCSLSVSEIFSRLHHASCFGSWENTIQLKKKVTSAKAPQSPLVQWVWAVQLHLNSHRDKRQIDSPIRQRTVQSSAQLNQLSLIARPVNVPPIHNTWARNSPPTTAISFSPSRDMEFQSFRFFQNFKLQPQSQFSWMKHLPSCVGVILSRIALNSSFFPAEPGYPECFCWT